MGGQRTEDSLGTTETAADNCDGADGARSKHGALARSEYDLLASEELEASEALEALERGPARAGPAAGEDCHGDKNQSAVRIR